MRDFTENELTVKAERYCVSAERCPSDVEEKLQKWGASSETINRIMARLVKERYVDANRFCRFFVRDKYRFNQWGRMKIVQALRMKHFSSEEINAGLEEIDMEEYDDILRNLLKKKAANINAASDYERNNKLIRFAIGKGFTIDEIMRHIKPGDFDERID